MRKRVIIIGLLSMLYASCYRPQQQIPDSLPPPLETSSRASLASTSSENAEITWKTFSSTILGITFQYPQTSWDSKNMEQQSSVAEISFLPEASMLGRKIPYQGKMILLMNGNSAEHFIIVDSTSNAESLLTVIRARFGQACTIELQPERNGMNKVKIGVAANTSDSCNLPRTSLIVLFSESQKKVAYLNWGQEPIFRSREGEVIDGMIAESFRFIDEK